MAAFSSSSFHQLIVDSSPSSAFIANSHHHQQQSNYNYNNIGAAAFSHEFYQPAAETDLHQNNNIDHHNFNNNNNTNISMDNSSSIVTAQNPTMDDKKKRKVLCSKDASNSPNSAQSKDMRGVKAGKKPRKTKNGEEKTKQLSKEKEKKLGEKEGAPEGYIHVRARRGQATDSHSLAERVRRERISERMKLLQALVPGCDKVTGKALMLDEIINYVQSLQNQVEFLSMKLASVNPMYYDFGMDFESFMVRPDQNLSSLASSPLQCSSPTTSNPYPILNNNSDHNSLMFQQPQIPNSLPLQQQGHRQMLWEMEDQRQKIINQAAGMISNTLFQFH